IQAFEPILVEGKAIQLHPLVCRAFNADFDGDQMAVHLPLSAEAQAEARVLMLSSNNLLSPASGRPMVDPTQDMIFGAYYLTLVDGEGATRHFRNVWEVERAYESGAIRLHEPIVVRDPRLLREEATEGTPARYEATTAGRVFFNEALPEDFPYVNHLIGKQAPHTTGGHVYEKVEPIMRLVERLADQYSNAVVASTLDRVKDLGFTFASRSGLTMSIDDVRTPPDKKAILDRFEKEAEKAEQQFKRGIITDDERRNKEVEIWETARGEVGRAMDRTLGEMRFNPLDMMVTSGARGNPQQVRQIAGMKGLVTNPKGEMIPRPITSSFREGLAVLEYFISTHGARKGLADTALRTADSGYLTRRLVDVAQELIIKEEDCGTARGIWLEGIGPDEPGRRTYLDYRLYGRVLLEAAGGFDAGTLVSEEEMLALRDDSSVTRVRVRSPLTCDAVIGVCANCYGMSLAFRKIADLGEAVGVIAAQSIGEPGTQLTMRTFHTGGIAGAEDITQGLPRVVELFEARTPKGAAVLARTSGVVRISDEDNARRITIVGDDGSEETHTVSPRAHLEVREGQEVAAGDALVEGPKDPKQLLDIKGIRETQQYLVEEVQKVYRDQGVSIHDKHIELIVRQMLRRVSVADPGESEFLPGERVDAKRYADVNRELVQAGKRPAEGRPELMGITKASLATDSWLSAASFQETTRVLTEAAIEGRSDGLVGLKENIIIGKLIPAGTGMMRYRDIELDAPDYQPMAGWSSDMGDDEDLSDWLARRSTSESDAAEALSWLSGAAGGDSQPGEESAG
ncbi:MAG TPA: DNA-directed RNA polymerase subunit beta', partial [Acidimicrobiales bacterium]|nr:DNA-directed RNA polymerase subunit beta' [Acidimicrobiales bacterium]